MPKTSAYIHFPLYDIAIKADATFSCNSVQPFSNPADLADFNICSKLATFESNFWLLGGANKLAPNTYSPGRIGLVTAEASGSAGTFATNPVLTIIFGSAHAVNGVTLYFSETDWASEATIYYYDASDVILDTRTIYPTSRKYYDDLGGLANVKKIIITFIKTNNPYRFIKLENIDFGRSLVFSGNELKRATVIEEIDPTSIQSPTNSLELEVISSAELLSIIDAAEDSGWPLDAYELIDNDVVYMGRFYVDEWEQPTTSRVRISCVDRLKLLENQTYFGMVFYDSPPYTIGGMIDNMAYYVGFDYTIDPDLSAIGFTNAGMYYTNVRDALQKIAMAAGGYVTCSRSASVDIKKIRYSSGSYNVTLENSDIKINKPAKLRQNVTGVNVVSTNFRRDLSAPVEKIYESDVSVGECMLIYNYPSEYANDTDSTATYTPLINDWGGGKWMQYRTYRRITVTSPGLLSFDGVPYIRSKTNHSIGSGNFLNVAGNEFISLALGPDSAQRIYDYYQQRGELEIRTFGINVQPGDVIKLPTINVNKKFYGVVESVKSEMASGLSQNLKLIGAEEPNYLIVGQSGSGAYSFAANNISLTKYTAAAGGVISSLFICCNLSANVRVGVYSDNAGSPDALLSQSSVTSVVAGINEIQLLADAQLTSSTDYWLAFNQDTAGAVCVLSGSGTGKYKSLTISSLFPDSAGTGYTSWTGKAYIYGMGFR